MAATKFRWVWDKSRLAGHNRHMIISKQLPTAPANRAAVAVLSTDPADDPTNAPFVEWMNAPRDTQPRRILDAWQIDLDVARALVSECPTQCPAGDAWAAEMRRVIDLTLSDTVREFDVVATSEWDQGIVETVMTLAGDLRSVSPLLAPVADAIEEQMPTGRLSIGELAVLRSRITSTHVAIHAPGDLDEGDYYFEDDLTLALVAWEHVDLLRGLPAGSTYAQVSTALTALDETLPPAAPGDSGVARGNDRS